MADNSDIDDLVFRWEDALAAGEGVSLDELCKEVPELRPEVERRIRALDAMRWMSEPTSDEEGEQKSPPLQGQHLGRYRLEQLIGEGGFGEVWRAYDPHLDRHVAIKVPRLDRAAPIDMDAFIAEARRVASLQHPGIVPVFDVGQSEGRWFIVSELIDGQDLSKLIAGDRPSCQESARIVAEVAEHLHFAHERGFVHRDIKPSNILLDREGKAYLADFGIAVSDQDETSHEPLGTLAYAAPERLEGEHERVDIRADIYSLGVVLYELLTGQLPFSEESPSAVRKAILSDSPPPPSSINSAVPAALDSICLRALSKEPANRFSTASDFSEAILEAVGQKRRRTLALPLALTVAAILLGIGLWAVWQASRPDKPAHPPDEQPATSVPGTVGFDGHQYKYVKANITWHEANRRCEALGGHLLIINDAPEQEFVADLLGHDRAYVLIGLTDEGHEDDWRWVDGSPLTFENWARDEPSNRDGIEHYGAINPASGGLWLDIAGEHQGIAGFICEWDSPSASERRPTVNKNSIDLYTLLTSREWWTRVDPTTGNRHPFVFLPDGRCIGKTASNRTSTFTDWQLDGDILILSGTTGTAKYKYRAKDGRFHGQEGTESFFE